MATNSILQLVKGKIRYSDRFEFESYFTQLALRTISNFIPTREFHDKGCDGYSIEEELFFQSYAPEQYRDRETIDKITEEYKKFKKWPNLEKFKSWIFVTKENLTGKPHQRLISLGSGKIRTENWGLDKLLELSSRLRDEELIPIFNLPHVKKFSEEQSIKLWPSSLGGNEELNLDNLATLRYLRDATENQITLVLDLVPFKIDEPDDTTVAKEGHLSVSFNTIGGKIKFADFVSLNKTDEKTFLFDKLNKRHIINLENRRFVVTLKSITLRKIPHVHKALECKFGIKEE